MMRGATILWAMLAAVAGTGLFLLKYEVQAQEEHLRDLRKDIVETEESIHVLRAEWSYLNDPLRLREEAERHLGLHPLKPAQILASVDVLPMAGPQPAEQPPIAAGQPDAVPAPVAVPLSPPHRVEHPPVEARQTTKPLAKSPPATKPLPPGHSVTAQKAEPAPRLNVAAAKPPAVKPLPATSRPAYQALPAAAAAPATTAANIMVITSPALVEPEMASTRSRP